MENEKCKTKTGKLKILNFELWFLVFSFSLLVIFLCGCSTVVSPYVVSNRQEVPHDANFSDCYYQTQLKKSGALNVIPIISKRENELLSQSRSVVASLGQSGDGYKVWFNMVSFDEVTLTAKRKYFFLIDERVKRVPNFPGQLFMEPKRGLMFDCQMVMENAGLDKPYGSENARQIAILRQVLKNLRKDIDALGQGANAIGSDNKTLSISALLMNQVFYTILHTLDKSPVLASTMSEKSGIEFDHINFGKGNIRMVVEGDIVTVKIRLGVFRYPFKSAGQQPAAETNGKDNK